jgi:hypothetical protein
MKKITKYIGMFIAVILIAILVLYSSGDIGITKANIEKDARVSQKISDDWQGAKATTGTMSAMLFYSDDLEDHIFSIYVNRPGLSFGYFFREGGSILETQEDIEEILIEGYNERAFLSMNKQQVSKVEIGNGNNIKVMEIDSEKPFAFIVPTNVGSINIYDINGNIIKSIRQKL